MGISRVREAIRLGSADPFWTARLFKDSPSAPTPPDPNAVANAQTLSNQQTARTNAVLGNPNINTPYGSQSVKWGGASAGDTAFNFSDPKAQAAYQGLLNDPTNRVSTDPKAVADQLVAGWGLGKDAYSANPGFGPDGTSQATVTQTLNPANQGILDSQNKISQGMLDTGQTALGTVQKTLSQPFDMSSVHDIYDKAYAAQTARLDPQWQRQQTSLETKLTNQGLRPGDEAWTNAQADLNYGKNDAYQQATNAAIGTMPQTYGLARSAYTQPLDVVNALRTGSQVQNPTFQPYQGGNVAPTNTLQAQQMYQSGLMGQYNAGVGSANSFNSGLMSMIGTGAMYGLAASDRRLKSNIVRVGAHRLGIGVYDYVIFGKPARGVMADEVAKVMPEAVVRHPDGYDMVDYARIGGL